MSAARMQGQLKYIYHLGKQEEEYYDLKKDPPEKNNLIGKVGKKEQDRLRSEILALHAEATAATRSLLARSQPILPRPRAVLARNPATSSETYCGANGLATDAERRSKAPFQAVLKSGTDVRTFATLAPAIGRAVKARFAPHASIQLSAQKFNSRKLACSPIHRGFIA